MDINSNISTSNNKAIVEKIRAGFDSGVTRPLEYRKFQLERLKTFLIECEEEILDALQKDMRKSRQESLLYEIEIIKREIVQMVLNLDQYASPVHITKNLLAVLDHAYILSEPYGVVLILSPFNYPIMLTIGPLVGVIAAGCTAILKPSELSFNSTELMAKKLPEYLDPNCFTVIQGDLNVTNDLLQYKFDYIFFTGSPNIGRIILREAAKHLTPCTLELGGKSPCFIHDSANFKIAAKRILWAKCINLGQTCIAPDYILCSKAAEIEFLIVARQVIKEWYGDLNKLQNNPDLPRMISQRHFLRLQNMLNNTKGKIAFGGNTDKDELWIEPTIVTDVPANDSLMEEEIFGPILPIVNVNSDLEALKFILAKKAKPLAMYIFSNDELVSQKFLEQVSCGSVCVNDCIFQTGWDGLQFGGVGESGMGAYHGKFSFDTFSHKKAVLHRDFGYLSEKLGESRYPPYTQQKVNIFKAIIYNVHYFNLTPKFIASFVFFVVSILIALVGIFFR